MEHPLFTPGSVVSCVLFIVFFLVFIVHWELSDTSGKALFKRLLNYIAIYLALSYFVIFFSFKKFSYAPIFLLGYFGLRYAVDSWSARNSNEDFLNNK